LAIKSDEKRPTAKPSRVSNSTADNPDSGGDRSALRNIASGRPSVSPDLDCDQGIGAGNSELMFNLSGHVHRDSSLPGTYGSFGGYPDAQF
jgi:hypothetical protein